MNKQELQHRLTEIRAQMDRVEHAAQVLKNMVNEVDWDMIDAELTDADIIEAIANSKIK